MMETESHVRCWQPETPPVAQRPAGDLGTAYRLQELAERQLRAAIIHFSTAKTGLGHQGKSRAREKPAGSHPTEALAAIGCKAP
jgi:hypothetical protein